MTTDTFELPPVAHIVAELDDYETSEFDVGMLPVDRWISPSPRRTRRRKRFWHAIVGHPERSPCHPKRSEGSVVSAGECNTPA